MRPGWRGAIWAFASLLTTCATTHPEGDQHQQNTEAENLSIFSGAEARMAAGDYVSAAEEYVARVRAAPRHPFADRALNNAGVCFEKAGRFADAEEVYDRIVHEYPRSSLVGAALFRVAVNAEQSYAFDKAIEMYRRAAKEHPESKDRNDALFNAARLLESLGRYEDAVAGYMIYADQCDGCSDGPKQRHHAALLFGKGGDAAKELAALNQFIERYREDASQAELVIDAKRRTADVQLGLGRDEEAFKAYRDAADDFDVRKLDPQQFPLAADAAAQARFRLAERQMAAFDKLVVEGSGSALAARLGRAKDVLRELHAAYGEVFKYGRLDWTCAALFRRAFAMDLLARKLTTVSAPPEVAHQGKNAVAAYRADLAGQAEIMRAKAAEQYHALIDEAARSRAENEWVRRARQALERPNGTNDTEPGPPVGDFPPHLMEK